jgi:hypothetical protein
MLNSLVDALFGCAHRRTTFPLTPARRTGYTQENGGGRAKTYVACLDCGTELDYDWKSMRVGSPVTAKSQLATAETVALHQ